jgi:hypothetical protein
MRLATVGYHGVSGPGTARSGDVNLCLLYVFVIILLAYLLGAV